MKFPSLLSLMILCLASISGCRTLGIPSTRFEDFAQSGGPEEGFDPGLIPLMEDEEFSNGDCCDEQCAPTPADFGLRKWWADCLQAKKNPPWPRFHPVPSHPVFQSETPIEVESSLEYGRFGSIEAIPHAARQAAAAN